MEEDHNKFQKRSSHRSNAKVKTGIIITKTPPFFSLQTACFSADCSLQRRLSLWWSQHTQQFWFWFSRERSHKCSSLQRKCVWYQRNISVSIQAVPILEYTQSTHNICRIHISVTAYLSYWMHYYISKSLYLPCAAPIKSQSSRRSPFI